jgi:hypothetical protein
MRQKEFKNWLLAIHTTRKGSRLGDRPRNDAVSRCKRIEKHEGELDGHYHQDKMKSLLRKLSYTQNDQEAGVTPPIPIGGDKICNGISSLKNAAKLYRQFCEYYY